MINVSGECKGTRKVVLTKWMLVIYSAVTFGYLLLLGFQGQTPPDNFLFNFTLGVGGIGGAFSIGNILEHRYGAMVAGVSKKEGQ